MLYETRTALQKAGLCGPYVLLPHSMSGLEALYWATQYPNEVEAIIGLDMAMPKAYENKNLVPHLLRLHYWVCYGEQDCLASYLH